MYFIITGGAGFIGSHLTEQLLGDGHHVTIVDNLATGRLKNLPKHSNLKFLAKNVLDCEPNDFSQPIDGIAHLAATPSVTESWLNPLEAHHNNLSAIVVVLLLCQGLQIPKLVFASSAAVYGTQTELPIVEAQKPSPISLYGLQKLVSEQYAHLWAEQFDLSVIALRLFNVFGPRQLPDSPYSGVISIFTNAMKENLPITIYGDGQQTRDFIYVKDVAIAFAKALTMSCDRGSFLTCNVGLGQETSLLELANIIGSCIPECNSAINFADARSGDIKHSRADVSKLSSDLNFIPQWSVEDGLKSLISSLSENEFCK